MRFDLAINGMTYGAWKTGKLPLMRDGTQWRPMLHVRDAASVQIFMLEAEPCRINKRIFNVGSKANNYQLKDLAQRVARCMQREVEIEWYGDPDHRSYRVSFDRIERLGWQARATAEGGVAEILSALDAGKLDRTLRTITLDWYREISTRPEAYDDLLMYGGMLDIVDNNLL